MTAAAVVTARRLLVATGLHDELPDVPGLAGRWGVDVLHCPYCHGWEVRDKIPELSQPGHPTWSYSGIGVGAGYPPASMSWMRVGPAGDQPRSPRVWVLVAARSMAKKVPMKPK